MQFKTGFYFNIFKIVMYSCYGIAIFSILLQHHIILQKSFYYADLMLKKFISTNVEKGCCLIFLAFGYFQITQTIFRILLDE